MARTIGSLEEAGKIGEDTCLLTESSQDAIIEGLENNPLKWPLLVQVNRGDTDQVNEHA